jgi:alpha-L-rhamnosidase
MSGKDTKIPGKEIAMSGDDETTCGFPRPRKWKAKWIWAAIDGKETNVHYRFRKEFVLGEPAHGHQIYITADTRYQLYINAEFVGRGPPQSQPFLQYYDVRDVSRYLKQGVNCIAVIVNHVGNLPDTRGGLLLELVDAQHRTVLASDGEWRVRRAQAWQQDTYCSELNKTVPYQEFFDARKVSDGWNVRGFDASDWSHAVVLAGRISDRPPAVIPWSRLVSRDIPSMSADPVLPARIERIEESVDLVNRSRANDLAPGLSLVGRPVRYSKVVGAPSLCSGEGVTVVQSSRNHEDLDFDGLYSPAVVLDFGRIITARVRIHLHGVAGGMIDIGYAERLIDGHFNIAMECEFADRYIMKDGEQVFEPFSWRAFRFVKLRFRSCPEPIEVLSVKGIVSTYPYREKGVFSSSDETLNAVFEISRETVRLCSNEALMDTPWREQAQWLGDVALVTLPVVYACFGDTHLPGKFLRQAANNQHPTGMISNISNTVSHAWQSAIPDYSLWYVRALWNHYMYTGEPHWIHRFYPHVLRVLYAHLDYLNEHGLLEDMPYWVFIDWANVDRRGECAAYNAIFYGALEAVLEMSRFKNDVYVASLVEAVMTDIKASFQARLFSPERGCFADANIDGQLSSKISEHANMAAIRWGLCDEAAAQSIIAAFYQSDDGPPFTEAQPFFTAVVLDALERAGRVDLALRLIRDRWGERMIARGATSTYEEWYQNGSWRDGEFKGFLRSHSHAWSAYPACFLIRSLMGLEILEPGCRKVCLNPQRVSFDYAVTYPTPPGPITVTCRNGQVDGRVPDGVSVVTSNSDLAF